ncbi:MAG TPA: ATP-binding protein [Bryobacteraceae bacterium]|nr:ATP-binding protein [Bryobacteraceae bacterium]
MRVFLKRRLQLQLLFILLAAVLIATLSVILISDAVKSAEGVVLTDALKTLAAAASELDQQYRDRTNADSAWHELPIAAQDTSLRGVSQAVLRSYPGVEGGYHDGAHFLGYSYPTHDTGKKKTDVPTAELDDILGAISQSRGSGTAQRVLRGQHDIVVIEAKAGPNGVVSWTMKRLPGQSDPAAHRREMLLAGLVLAALISIAGTLATGVALQRGVGQIKSGLAALGVDFSTRLPERNGELGEISRCINGMAEARQKLENDLRRADRLRTIGKLVASIAHEIRNPLNSIRLSIQYLERRLRDNQVRAEDLHPVIDEVDRLSSLLTNLLVFQKTREAILREEPVAPVLRKCLALMRPQADSRAIEIRYEPGAPEIEACFDSEQLIQVVMNLLLNALEAIGTNGTIEVRTERREDRVRICVQDSGPGLTEEQAEHLFEAFYTTKPEGTGLGLAVSRELVVNMGGALRLVNDGPGATFEIELPAAGTQRPPADREYASFHDTDR